MLMEYRKAKSAPKLVVPQGDVLRKKLLDTLDKIARIVGGTLGPGGRPVLIERPEQGLPPMVTKDGVTVFQSLGFRDSIAHVIMEGYREVAVRTANEAGDGTTTATILADAITKRTFNFCATHPGYSPHRVVREVTRAFGEIVEPELKKRAIPVSLEDEAGRLVLKQVAMTSANGDEELADKVLECYDICGDAGNVTLVEAAGPPTYEVEELEGYPILVGYENSAKNTWAAFLNRPAEGRTLFAAPLFLLHYGPITSYRQIEQAMQSLSGQKGIWGNAPVGSERGMVVVATGFSDTVIGSLATNFGMEHTVKIVPIVAPMNGIAGSQRAFLDDLAAVVGARVLDPLNAPIETATWEDLGACGVEEKIATGGTDIVWRGRTDSFEYGRWRSTVFGYGDPEGVELRVAELEESAKGSGHSMLEAYDLRERLARLSGGIARLTIRGFSNGETKERKDRAEDAVCAVRGALKQGAIFGGCWGLLCGAAALVKNRPAEDGADAVTDVLLPSLREPLRWLLDNVGIVGEEAAAIAARLEAGVSKKKPEIFDALQLKYVSPAEAGVYDSLPAVLEALRSALSMSATGGTMGGIVAFDRDDAFEREDARDAAAYRRHVEEGNVVNDLM